MRRSAHGGFSLVETLVVLAIISILTAMLATSLTKAVRMAKATASGEAFRQESIGNQVDPPKKPTTSEEIRADARRAFRQVLDYGKGETIVSELRYVVRNNSEFRAYWRTLLDRRFNLELEFTQDGSLIAETRKGEEFILPPIGRGNEYVNGRYVVAWEFISTDLTQTSRGDIGGTVYYNDGHRQYERYPGQFPMSAPVARFSRQFVDGQ